MLTFIIFVLYTLRAPWWVYVLSIIGVIEELDSSDLVHRNDKFILTNHDVFIEIGKSK